MRRREDLPLTKKTMYFYAGDYEKIQAFYPARIGAAKIIRDVIHAFVRNIEENAAQRVPLVHDLDVQVEPNHEQ